MTNYLGSTGHTLVKLLVNNRVQFNYSVTGAIQGPDDWNDVQ